MLYNIVMWTLTIILVIVVGGGAAVGVALSYLDQHQTKQRRMALAARKKYYAGSGR